jgi:hypothetical protein
MSDIREPLTGDSTQLEEYMKTPCNHKFHEVCLRDWLNIKLECPTCRTEIPAFPNELDDESDEY